MKRTMQVLLICAALFSASAHAGRSLSGEGSQTLSEASGMVVLGSMSVLVGSGAVMVTGMRTVGESTEVVFTRVADGVSATVRLSGKAVKSLSLAAGSAVQVVAMSTGHMLVASGKAIAFIPNEVGAALLHHSRVQ